jgi:hypothetical protein
LKVGPRHLLDDAPTPSTLERRANPTPLVHEALKYVESGRTPQRNAYFFEVRSLLANLVTMKPPQPGLIDSP